MIIILFLTSIVWLAYFRAVNCGFVSDDFDGLINYDGKFKGWDYNHLLKFLLYKLFGKSAKLNHFFSILVHNINVILLYLLLRTFLPLQITLYTCILFAIHPVTTQAVAWISGRGYLFGLFYCLLLLNIVNIFYRTTDIILYAPYFIGTVAVYGFLYYLAIHAQFATLMTFCIQILFANYFLAFVGMVITGIHSLGIIKEVIGIRKKTFEEQNLGRSTKFNLRKFIVAVKSLGYYTILALLPRKMGLYHTYNYHYTDDTEQIDGMFLVGWIITISCVLGLIYGSLAVKFAVVWYLAYIFIFLNWITIHQFISERYLYIPVIGICIILSLAFAYYPPLFFLISGLYLCRTWSHIPTYNNEVLFYQSNVWNFQNSEVAFGNLGVTYMKCGLHGSALDAWRIAEKINPQYDVALYNLSSVAKRQGDLVKARDYLKKAVDSPMCHFKDVWSRELVSVEHEIKYLEKYHILRQRLNQLLQLPDKKDEASKLKMKLENTNMLHKTLAEERKKNVSFVEVEQSRLTARMVELEQKKEDLRKPIPAPTLVAMRDKGFDEIEESLNKLNKNNERTIS